MEMASVPLPPVGVTVTVRVAPLPASKLTSGDVSPNGRLTDASCHSPWALTIRQTGS